MLLASKAHWPGWTAVTGYWTPWADLVVLLPKAWTHWETQDPLTSLNCPLYHYREKNQTGQRASVSFNSLIRLFTVGLAHYHTGAAEKCQVLQPDALLVVGVLAWSLKCVHSPHQESPSFYRCFRKQSDSAAETKMHLLHPAGLCLHKSTCPHGFCAHAHIAFLRKISWAVSWVMTLKPYVFSLDIKIWSHSLDKQHEQLNAKNMQKSDKSKPRQENVKSHRLGIWDSCVYQSPF